MCGGTSFDYNLGTAYRGLSPRVRGNPARAGQPGMPARSIPACAGEPMGRHAASAHRKVYPRVCGGTAGPRWGAGPESGLSPRVRGNRAANRPPDGDCRSIPACAGEPTTSKPDGWRETVYPRVCGGTLMGLVSGMVLLGLSPRVRGNPAGGLCGADSGGSIPACAGEPRPRLPGGRQDRVYPRVCGGTRLLHSGRLLLSGLSPRVRGNPVHPLAFGQVTRSIPACAGEPVIQDEGPAML